MAIKKLVRIIKKIRVAVGVRQFVSMGGKVEEANVAAARLGSAAEWIGSDQLRGW